MDAYLAGLATESVSETTRDIDLCSTQEMVEMMNREDARVAEAVHAATSHRLWISSTVACGGVDG